MTQSESPAAEAPGPEPVWTFRGYEMRPAEFNTAMVHFYRGEVQRSNTWRTRLDNTTNWAVVAAGAAISFALSDPNHHYGVIILDTLLVTLFLWIEARRYRYYELWSHRVRLMETDFFASMLVPPFAPSPDWAESLAESLLNPDFPISMWEAFGRRFRRNYLWIFLVLAAAWALKGFLHPTPVASFSEFIVRSALGPLPGWVILIIGLVYNGALFIIGFATAGLNQASGEVLPRWGGEIPILSAVWRAMQVPETSTSFSRRAAQPSQRTTRKRQQLLALIISSKPKGIADRVMKEMKRGVTALHGRGMYAQQERDVLMIAVTVTEMQQLKAMAKAEDPNAFIIVAPAQEILGRGFQPLEG
ncbi:MAG: DUF2270 domain-containing protein [Chloroflexi bacterium]|nr:DUF2270 domain-containing protein [Chloroflexota bacterium]